MERPPPEAKGPAHEPDDDMPPCEQPGASRGDCASHRGVLLRALASVCLVSAVVTAFFPYLVVVVLPAAIAVRRMATADLQKMAAGLIDSRSETLTERARRRAWTAACLCILWLVVWPVVIVAVNLLLNVK